jgi:hypothetical protein
MPWIFLLCSLFATSLWAAEPLPPAIEQAQALIVKKDRQGAAAVLNKAVEALPAGTKGRAKLVEAMNGLSRVFFTDKGQRLFEAGQAVMFENPDLALNQLREALSLEDENLLILNNIARVQLAKQDCATAQTTLKRARTLNPYAADAAILELRALLCLKNFEAFREKVKQVPSVDKATEAQVQYLSAQDFFQQKMWRRANEVLNKVSEDEPRFPETYYWLRRTALETNGDGSSFAEKYVSLCKNISGRERRQYAFEPRLCANAKEVEDELANKSDE